VPHTQEYFYWITVNFLRNTWSYVGR
jgi:hypothetical protein